MKATPSKSSRPTLALLHRFAVALALTATLGGCKTFMSGAKGRPSDIKCEPSMGVIDKELDAGIDVKLTVTNVGEAGYIKVSPELSTSEGEWSRSQNLRFNKGESKSLTYFFHEPTINVFEGSTIQCRVGVSPMADD